MINKLFINFLMKQICTFFISLTFLAGFAGNVTLETAMVVGKNFYYERINRDDQKPYANILIRGTYTESYQGNTVYYALDFADGGWVIVSSEDHVTPVLAYSYEGLYTREDQPPQFIAWMEGYAKQIEYARRLALPATESVKESWEHLKTNDPSILIADHSGKEVTPMLTSTWNQGNPYNFLCPADPSGPGGHVYSGCVATAMAQVLYYYRWPVTGTGMHCYVPDGYPQQCADFENTTYAWNEMLNSMVHKDTAMALLQWHCGIAVDMMYSPSGSGAFSEDAADALVSYFRYHPNTGLEYKDNYSEAAWANLLIENLDARRPMYYHGFGSGGHAFNVDGYQGSDYFHFNWGWGGSFNGYFYLNNLNPGGNNFTQGQGAIVNIYPDTLQYSYPLYCSGQTVFTSLNGTFEDGSCPQNYQNNTNCSWLIAPESPTDSVESITISFQRFNTESDIDLVSIYQGPSANGELVAQYSGDNIPSSVTVEGATVYITFVTNTNTTEGGWFASYYSESMDWCQGTITLTDPQGTFSDGSFDFQYKNSTICRWKIQPEGTGAIQLNFTAFRTEPDNDIVSIYDLGTEELLASYSGIFSGTDVPGPVVAPSGQMFVMFITNNVNTEAGWEAEYITFPVGNEEIPVKDVITIYPNPVADVLHIDISNEYTQKIDYSLLTIDGKTVFKDQDITDTGITRKIINVTGLAQGVYVLQVMLDSGVITRKVVIN